MNQKISQNKNHTNNLLLHPSDLLLLFGCYLLKNYVIVNKQFNDKVIYTILLPIDKLSILGGYNYEILSEEYIEKVEI